MNNLYNNDITSLEYTGHWFLKWTFGLFVWFFWRQIYSASQVQAEEQSKARNNE